MNLRQMQMVYGQAPNGQVRLVPAKPQWKFENRMLPRMRQGQTRKAKGDYRPAGWRPSHDNAWK